MRRRRGDPVEQASAELVTFDPARWRPLVVVDPPPGTADVESWLDLAAYDVWREARTRWDGWWPGDTIDRLREQVAAKRALAARRGERR